MFIRTDGLPWPLAPRLRHILQNATSDIPASGGAVVSFRDPDYSACTGGFHPVEFGIDRDGKLLYITDFAFVGRPPDTELVKEIDFDFTAGVLHHFGVEHPVSKGQALFAQYQANFLAYHELGAYVVSIEPMG